MAGQPERPRPPQTVDGAKAKRKRLIRIGVYVLVVIWAAFVFEAGMARFRLGLKREEVLLRGSASDILIYELEVMDANEDLVAAIVPIIGRPIYHGASSVEREKLTGLTSQVVDLEARIGR